MILKKSTPNAPPLPVRDGVGPSCVALQTGPWATITDCLVQRFPAIPRTTWLARMQAHDVVDEYGQHVTATRPYQAPLRVYYYRELPTEVPIPFNEVVLFQDAHLLVVDKPHFLPVTPAGKYLQQTLLVRLKRRLGVEALVPIHRIDRETAGLVLFSLQASSRGSYQQLFAEREVTKHYEAIVHWTDGRTLPSVYSSRLEDDTFMRMHEVPGEPNATTHIQVTATTTTAAGSRAKLQLSPVTGRKHQLRVQCAALGIPILHDRIYPKLLPEGTDDFAHPLQLLAKHLRFTDPVTGALREFTSPRTLVL